MNHNIGSGIIQALDAELIAARKKFPSNKQLLHAFNEESGEVTKALLDLQQGKATADDVRKELIQVMSMCTRLLQEGDPEFPEFTPPYK